MKKLVVSGEGERRKFEKIANRQIVWEYEIMGIIVGVSVFSGGGLRDVDKLKVCTLPAHVHETTI